MIEWMPSIHRKINVWQQRVQRENQLPPTGMSEVQSPQDLGFCYLILFEEWFHNVFQWPAFLTWQELWWWNGDLRKEGTFGLKEQGSIWHVTEEGPYSWIHVEQLALSHQANDTVGFFVWTMEMAALLANALGGYKVWFRKDAPQL